MQYTCESFKFAHKSMTFPITWRFPVSLLVLFSALLIVVRPNFNGDVVEYSLTTIAVADHGTPDIRLDNIATATSMLPRFAAPYAELERGMRAGSEKVYAAFARGREAKVYAIHFFGYSALAAIPYKMFDSVGVDPMKGFVAVNLMALFILGLCLRRLFGSDLKAWAALLLFMLCGGDQYWQWTSPECMSAAALLSGLILFCTGAPMRGALLAGLAATQNPTILAFFFFAPLLKLCLHYDSAASMRDNAMRTLPVGPTIAALVAGVAVFALPILFNLYQFGVPNIIARLFSDPSFVGMTRLVSFFFDLNQGMIVAIPGVLLALALWGWRNPRREAVALALCCAFTLTLVIPALAVLNWNSDAAGVMRYAFWSSMPIVFALLWRLRQNGRWPLPLLVVVFAIQALCTWSARTYSYVEFSPAANFMLRHAPGLYHPEPEIFVERSGHHDDYYSPDKVYLHSVDGKPVKTLYNSAHPGIEQRLCGKGGKLAPDNRFTDSYRGWRYIDGALRCSVPPGPAVFELEQFKAGGQLSFDGGWSAPEAGGGEWNGAWSVGQRSRIVITLAAGAKPDSLTMLGNYFGANTRTRVSVNGKDLGWHALGGAKAIALTPSTTGKLEIELEHEAPTSPGGPDTRTLALFLRRVTVE